MAAYRIGIDIGGTNTKGALVGDDGALVAQVEISTEATPEGVVATAAGAVARLLANAGVGITDVCGVGVGVPGIVDSAGGAVAQAANLGIAQPLALGPLLAAELGVPVVVDNDLNIAALGAAQLYTNDGGSPVDLAFVALGTGVAAGFVFDGEVRRGHGPTGEIGHIPLVPGGLPCRCGQRGCMERYCSGSALLRLWPDDGDTPGPRALFDAAAAGDPAAVAVRDGYCDHLAAAIRNLVLTVGPGRVVIGGGVARLGADLEAAVRAALARVSVGSPFLESLGLPALVSVADASVPIAALGAARLVG